MAPTDRRRSDPEKQPGGNHKHEDGPPATNAIRHLQEYECPHFDSHANSGIPGITGITHQFYSNRMNTDANKIYLQLLQLLHLLPHLNYNDVGTWMEPGGRDLQTLARAIMNRMGRSFLSSPNHSTSQPETDPPGRNTTPTRETSIRDYSADCNKYLVQNRPTSHK